MLNKKFYLQFERIMERNILLTPGPANTTQRVKEAQIVPDICPREKEFGDLVKGIGKDLCEIVAPGSSSFSCVMFGGSGTSAIEAALSSLVRNDEKILIIKNGAYGKRAADIAEIYGLEYEIWESNSFEPLDWEGLKKKVSQQKPHFIYAVHHETTTGLLNDLKKLKAVAQTSGSELIIDAISSYGAIPLWADEKVLKYIIASSNKNIQGMPGVGFVIGPTQSFRDLKNHPKRNYYLNIYEQFSYFEKSSQFRFTPPVQTIYSLRAAIDEFKEEGVDNRYQRYKDNWKRVQKGLSSLSLETLVSEENSSFLMTTVLEPKGQGYNFTDFHIFCYKRGVTIYPGKVGDRNTFRLSNIGSLSPNHIDEAFIVIGDYFKGLSD